jgi:hypothetical protein
MLLVYISNGWRGLRFFIPAVSNNPTSTSPKETEAERILDCFQHFNLLLSIIKIENLSYHTNQQPSSTRCWHCPPFTRKKNEHHIPHPYRQPSRSSHHHTQKPQQIKLKYQTPTTLLLFSNKNIDHTNPTQHSHFKSRRPDKTPPPPHSQQLDRLVSRRRHTHPPRLRSTSANTCQAPGEIRQPMRDRLRHGIDESSRCGIDLVQSSHAGVDGVGDFRNELNAISLEGSN